MKKLKPNEGIKVFDVRLVATTAGPSPDNNIRTDPPEAFFCEPQEKQLESNPNLALVKDILLMI